MLRGHTSTSKPARREPDTSSRPDGLSPFPQPADSLEIVKEDEYIIGDKDLLVNRRGVHALVARTAVGCGSG